MKPGDYCRNDNKPLTIKEFKAIINNIPPEFDDKSITMSSDEEGNEMWPLHSVNIKKNGQVTLWPMNQ